MRGESKRERKIKREVKKKKKNEPKIRGHCAGTVHTIKHRPGAESLGNYSPINASGVITAAAQDDCTGPVRGAGGEG